MTDSAKAGVASAKWSCDIMYLAREREVKMRQRKKRVRHPIEPGDRFGDWITLGRNGNIGRNGKPTKTAQWNVRCKCGYETVSQANALYEGLTRKCVFCDSKLKRQFQTGDKVGHSTIIGYIYGPVGKSHQGRYVWRCDLCGEVGEASVSTLQKRQGHRYCPKLTPVNGTGKRKLIREPNARPGKTDGLAGIRASEQRNHPAAGSSVSRPAPSQGPDIGAFVSKFRARFGKESAKRS